jgi:hypothetical protein
MGGVALGWLKLEPRATPVLVSAGVGRRDENLLVTILLLFSGIIRPVLAAVDFVNHRRTSSQQL